MRHSYPALLKATRARLSSTLTKSIGFALTLSLLLISTPAVLVAQTGTQKSSTRIGAPTNPSGTIFSQPAASANPTISYQGQLVGEGGAPIADGEHVLRIALFKSPLGIAGGATETKPSTFPQVQPIWEDQYHVTTRAGVFSLLLGSKKPLPDAAALDGALWLGVAVGHDAITEVTPVSAVPFALNVADGAVTREKISADYVAGIAVEGARVSGRAAELNIVGGRGIEVGYDPVAGTIRIANTEDPDGKGPEGNPSGKGAEVQANSTVTGDLLVIGNAQNGDQVYTSTGLGTLRTGHYRLFHKNNNFYAQIDASPQSTNRVYTLPDAGANADFVLTQGDQSLEGEKTFEDVVVDGSLVADVDGDLSGSLPQPTVRAIQGRAVADIAPSDGEVLMWKEALSEWVPGAVSGGGGGGGEFSLPYSENAASSSTLLSLTNTGSGSSGRFAISNAGSSATALVATTNGSGLALDASGPARVTGTLTLGNALIADGSAGTSTKFLRSAGSSASPQWSSLASADIPDNAANTSGTAANVTGTVAVTNGGTGASTASGARANLGLGSMATQNSNDVTITGGSVAGSTVSGNISGNAANVTGTVAVANGGTGATTASGARTNLGLGSIAVQNSNDVTITGGSVAGSTVSGNISGNAANVTGTVAVANGGTGATTASGARTNLGLGSMAVQNSNDVTITGGSVAGSTVSGNISGNAANVTGTVAVANGGTGADNASDARTNLGLGSLAVEDAAAGGDLDGTLPNPMVVALQGRSVLDVTPSDGEVLMWNDAESRWEPGTVTGGGDGGTFELPYTESVGSSSTLFSLTNTGSGSSGRFAISNAGSSATALVATTNGSGLALDASGPARVTGTLTLGNALIADGSAGTSTKFLRSAGSSASPQWSSLASADIPDNAANTSGTAANVTGTVAVANGGTGATTASGARTNLGLGSMAVQNSNDVTITGGTVAGSTVSGNISGNAANVTGTVAVANGGTGATTASGARTNLGLGSMATQNSNDVTITGGTVAGSTVSGNISGNAANVTGTVAVANGGTGATTATAARTNLGLGSMAVQNADDVAITGGSVAGSTVSGNISGNAANVTGTVAVANGGTGATTASAARTNLGLGSIATQNSNDVTITGGTVAGSAVSGNISGNAANVTGTVAVANGGTGATTASGARTNLGLGSMAVQNSNDVTITGGTVAGSTVSGNISGNAANVTGTVAVANGGTGATTASGARTNLGLGSMATQNSNDVTITGGTVAGSTVSGNISGNAANVTGTVAVANGGTGATTASGARTNLGLGSMATQNSNDVTITGGTVAGSTVSGNISGNAANVTGTVAVANGGTGADNASDARTNLGLGSLAVEDAAAGGDLDGALPNPMVVALQGRSVLDVTPSDGEVLMWNDAESRWEPGTVTGGGEGSTFELPYAESAGSSSTLFSLTNTGSGSSGRFAISNAGSSATALVATTNGSGLALDASGPARVTGTLTLGNALIADGSAGTSTKFLRSAGSSASPQWSSLASADIPDNAANTSGTATNVTGTVAVANGGTGATTASGARTNLGLGSMAVQNSNDVTITGGSVAGSTVSGNISGNAANVTGTVAVANGGTGATTASAARTNLGLGSMAVQNADDVAITGGSVAGSTVSGNISGNAANVTGTVAVANGGTGATTATAARTNLGLGSMATQNSNAVAITGGTITGTTITGDISGNASNVTGTVAVANGGTGATTASGARTNLGLGTMATQNSNAVSITGGSVAASTISGVLSIPSGGTGLSSAGASGNYLRSNGSNWVSSALAASDMTGTLAVSKGGTGSAISLTMGGVMYAASPSVILSNSAGNANQLLMSNGTGAPSWMDLTDIPTGLSNAPVRINSGKLSTGSINLINDVTATLRISNGGTGLNSAGVAGNFMRSDGSSWQSTPISASDIPSGSGNYIQNTTGTQASSNFNVSGSGAVGTAMAVGTTLTVGTNATVSGKLGIGMSPVNILDIAANNNSGTIAQVSNTNTGNNAYSAFVTKSQSEPDGFQFGSTSTAYAGPLQADNFIFSSNRPINMRTATAQPLKFGTNGTEVMRLLADGKVGFGTTTPTAQLEVSKTQNTGTEIVVRNPGTTSAAYAALVAMNNASNVAMLGINNTNDPSVHANRAYVYTQTAGLNLRSNGDIRMYAGGDLAAHERMRIGSTGNVGIGTTNATQALEIARQNVDGEIRIRTYDNSGGVASSYIELQRSRGTEASPAALQSGDVMGGLFFGGYRDDAFTSRAAIQAVTTQNWNSVSNGNRLEFRTTANNSDVITTRMIIDQNGNVGIGTSSPQRTLEVSNNSTHANQWAQLRLNNTSNHTAGMSFTRTGSSVDWVLGRYGSAGNERFAISNNTVNEAFTILQDGTVQLGGTAVATNPTLHVTPTGNVGFGTKEPTNRISTLGARNDAGIKVQTTESGMNIGAHIEFGNSNGGSYQQMAKMQDADGTLRFVNMMSGKPIDWMTEGNESTPKMRIASDGKVGIGTISPAEKLDVDGAVRFSGALKPAGLGGSTGEALLSTGGATAPVWGSPIPSGMVAAFNSDGARDGYTFLGSKSLEVTDEIWSDGADAPVANYEGTAAVYDGVIYYFGGATVNEVWAYTVATDEWEQKDPMPTYRYSHGAVTVGNKIYVIGGWNSGMLKDTWEYDPSNDTWTQLADLNFGRYDFGVTVLDGLIYVFGGSDESGEWDKAEVYDIGTDEWTVLSDLPAWNYKLCAEAVGDKIYILQGTGAVSGRTLYQYDPLDDTYTQKTSSHFIHYDHTSMVHDGRIYVFSGFSSDYSIVEMYNPATNSWTLRTPMPQGRYQAAGVTVDGKHHVLGGYNTVLGNYTSHTVYQPPTINEIHYYSKD